MSLLVPTTKGLIPFSLVQNAVSLMKNTQYIANHVEIRYNNVMECIKCGKKIEKDSKFCQFCGESVQKNDTSEVIEVDKEFLDHLDFLGYEVKKDTVTDNSQSYIAKHKSKYTLVFNQVSELGVSFHSFFTLNIKKVENNKLELLAQINKITADTNFVSFYIGENLNMFGVKAFYLGEYNKKCFADFIDSFQGFTQLRLSELNYLKKYT